MTKQQEFRKQTEEAKFEAFSLMCKKVAELEESNREWQRTCEAKSDTNSQLIEQLADKVEKIADLEKENAELKADNDARKFAMTMSEKVEKQLREEIAELNQKVIDLENDREIFLSDFYCDKKGTCKFIEAKELLKRYVPYRQITDSKAYKDLADETEQFLNSEVEK